MTNSGTTVVRSVAQRLPIDVLESIFLTCLPDFKPNYYDNVKFPSPSAYEAPMIYGQICRLWRDISLTTPRLWSFLRIPSQWDCAIGIEEWLRRSQPMPLSFQWNPRHVDYPTDILEQIIKLLVAQSTRWHQVIMHDLGDIVKQLLAPLKSGVPLLEALEVFASDMGDCYILNTTAAPRLQYLDITGEFWFDISATPSIQQFILREPIWTDSELSFSLWSPYRVFRDLIACPKLELVDIILHDMTVVPSDYQVELPSLRELTLRLSYESVIADVGSLLDKLTLPSLQALSIDFHDQDVMCPFLAIQSLICRSHASLTSLSLYGGLRGDGRLMSDDDLIDCILHSPDLNSPILQRIPAAGAFLTTLAPPSHSSDSDRYLLLCPVLEQLTFRSATFSESALQLFGESAWAK